MTQTMTKTMMVAMTLHSPRNEQGAGICFRNQSGDHGYATAQAEASSAEALADDAVCSTSLLSPEEGVQLVNSESAALAHAVPLPLAPGSVRMVKKDEAAGPDISMPVSLVCW
jgi:hypothetical protein